MKNKTAIVTGAAMGIGRATALEFAKHGANVIVADITDEKGQETVSLIKENTEADAIFVKTNVANTADVISMVSKTLQKFGRLDFACNNAGIGGAMKPLEEYLKSDWDDVIDINLKGVWNCMKHEIPAMLQNGKGVIVNIGSTFVQLHNYMVLAALQDTPPLIHMSYREKYAYVHKEKAQAFFLLWLILLSGMGNFKTLIAQPVSDYAIFPQLNLVLRWQYYVILYRYFLSSSLKKQLDLYDLK